MSLLSVVQAELQRSSSEKTKTNVYILTRTVQVHCSAVVFLKQDALFQAYALQNQYGIPHSEVRDNATRVSPRSPAQ